MVPNHYASGLRDKNEVTNMINTTAMGLVANNEGTKKKKNQILSCLSKRIKLQLPFKVRSAVKFGIYISLTFSSRRTLG